MTSSSDPLLMLLRYQEGDHAALDGLCAYYLPRLRQWARRLESGACRHGMTADDFVQEAFLRSLRKLEDFKPRTAAGLFCYLRTAVLNQARDQARRQQRRPVEEPWRLEHHTHPDPSPLEQILQRETRRRYERAFATLSGRDQEMVVVLADRRCTDRELATRFAKPSPNAARMARQRVLARFASALKA